MFRIVTRFFGVIVIVCTGGVGLALTVGGFLEVDAAAAVVTPGRRYIHDRSVIRLIDIDREVAVDIDPPVDDVDDIILGPGKSQALVLTDTNVGGVHNLGGYGRRVLYHFDPITGRLHPLTIVERENRINEPNIRAYYTPSWSPDGEKLAFYNPDSPGLYVTDLETLETQRIIELEIGPSPSTPAWSPDSQQVAFQRSSDVLLVIDADGSNLRTFQDLEPDGFAFSWSDDSESILLTQRFGDQMTPFRVIDARDGYLNPQTGELKGFETWWWCNRLVYTHDLQQESRITVVNLQTGRHASLREPALLEGVEMVPGERMPNCEWLLLIDARSASTSRNGRTLSPIYISNRAGNDVRLVSEAAAVVTMDRANDSVYYAAPGSADLWEVHKLRLDDDPQPARVGDWELNAYFGAMHWFDSDEQAIFISGTGTSRRLAKLDARSNKVQYLTSVLEYVTEYVVWER